MGCCYEEKVWALVGSGLLNRLSSIIDTETVGLYRNDGFGVLRNASGLKK